MHNLLDRICNKETVALNFVQRAREKINGNYLSLRDIVICVDNENKVKTTQECHNRISQQKKKQQQKRALISKQ